MRNEPYGDPVLTLRLPAWQINGLKQVAKTEDTTVSALIREMVTTLLKEHGVTSEPVKQIDG